jgi:hypothetical protein
MGAGRADEAETVLWEDLKRNPEHVWTLALLSKALRAQDKTADAELIDARYTKAFKGADAPTSTPVLSELDLARQGKRVEGSVRER